MFFQRINYLFKNCGLYNFFSLFHLCNNKVNNNIKSFLLNHFYNFIFVN